MWAKVNAAQVQQQNWVDLMTIDMMQLSVLQTQMDNICLQSTLITGFAIGMWAGETLSPFVEDDSQACIWKHNSSLVFGHIFFYCVAVCISCCVIIVTSISYIKQAAQEARATFSDTSVPPSAPGASSHPLISKPAHPKPAAPGTEGSTSAPTPLNTGWSAPPNRDQSVHYL